MGVHVQRRDTVGTRNNVISILTHKVLDQLTEKNQL